LLLTDETDWTELEEKVEEYGLGVGGHLSTHGCP